MGSIGIPLIQYVIVWRDSNDDDLRRSLCSVIQSAILKKSRINRPHENLEGRSSV